MKVIKKTPPTKSRIRSDLYLNRQILLKMKKVKTCNQRRSNYKIVNCSKTTIKILRSMKKTWPLLQFSKMIRVKLQLTEANKTMTKS